MDNQGTLRPQKICWQMACSLGYVYITLRRFEEAERLFYQALQACETHFGTHHHDTLHHLLCAGNCFLSQGKYQRAAQLFQKAADTCAKVLNPGDPWALKSRLLLALSCTAMKRDNAMSLLQQVANDYKRFRGPESIETLDVLYTAGRIFLARGNFQEAEDMLQTAYASHIRVFGWENLKSVMLSFTLADLYWRQQRIQEARHILEATLDHQSSILSSPSSYPAKPDLVAIFISARLLHVKGNMGEAKSAYQDFLTASHDAPSSLASFQHAATEALQRIIREAPCPPRLMTSPESELNSTGE
ncbi:hypothetical protein BDW59DRAFT_147615 [Aspergillus cavernicola]|uniref:MalT-like TPR region domain-containing protein n=1 Tax=Aspergillus cavernicola TaxID=176166 RepID=A0ABR4I9H3_9EURO